MRIALSIILFLTLLLASCGRKNEQSSSAQSTYADTLEDKKSIDTEKEKEKELYQFLVGDTITEETDGTFDDFIYSFAADSDLQIKRIIFPLPYYDGDGVVRLKKEDWVHDSLFVNNNFYTLLFDTEAAMDSIDSLSSKSVQLEWYILDEKKVKKYYFERINEMWYLEAINLREIEDSKGEDFFDFYTQFSRDSIFQSERIKQPLLFTTIDPDDDFSILETQLETGQWFAFQPPMPKDRLFNINYGQNSQDLSSQKIIVFRGIGNGFFNALSFVRERGKWRLYKFEDTSI